MKKRIAGVLLSLVMCLTLLPVPAAAAARFTDVPEDFWRYEDVELAVREGLVNGTTPTTYSPANKLTYGAAIKLAACMHKRMTTGKADFAASDPWYKTYLDYARANGIVTKDYNMTEAATRAGYMEIFAKAVPDTGLQSGYKSLAGVNRVDDGTIPDAPMNHPQAETIYKLYRAGILQGNDAAHNCNPSGNISRGAVAAILARIMEPTKRISFEMLGECDMTVTTQLQDVICKVGETATFTVAVSGGKAPYSYAWQMSNGGSWASIPETHPYFTGAKTDTLGATVEETDFTNGYRYRCFITDAEGNTVKSESANPVQQKSGPSAAFPSHPSLSSSSSSGPPPQLWPH